MTSLQVDNPEFLVERSISASSASAGGSVVSTEVMYEPYSLGSVRATLTITSSVGGEYVFPLHGSCTEPQPQGPFVIKTGFALSIPFKNVFAKPTTFQFVIDNPCFSLRSTSETIRPRKTHHINVSFELPSQDSEGDESDTCPRTGTLSVRCVPSGSQSGRTTPAVPPLSWVYYLKGIVP